MTRLLYKFPEQSVIVERLLNGYREGSDVLRVYQQFAAKVANGERYAHGVNMGWQLAIHDVSSVPGAVPMLSMILNDVFDDCMTALIDDAAFLTEVIAVHDDVLAAVQDASA